MQEWRYRPCSHCLGIKRGFVRIHAPAVLSPGKQSSVPLEQKAGRFGLDGMAKRRFCYSQKSNPDRRVIQEVA